MSNVILCDQEVLEKILKSHNFLVRMSAKRNHEKYPTYGEGIFEKI